MKEISIIQNIKDIDLEKWNEFVLNHPDGNFFQSSFAFQFFYGLPGYEPIMIAAFNDYEIKGILVAVIMFEPGLKKFFTRRCIVWGGPICHDKIIANKLLNELVVYTKSRSIYIELRNLFQTKNWEIIFKQNQFIYINWLNYIVAVKDIETVRKNINDSKRRQISKSLRAGANISNAQNIQQVKDLYIILSTLYKQKIKRPLPSFEFFERFFFNKSFGEIFIIEYNGKVIGGTVCPIYKNKIYELYVCGLDRTFKDIYPSVLATWAPIQYATQHRLEYFDFLGAGSPDFDYGVREFKSQFGGELVNLGRYLRVNNLLLYNIGKLGIKLKEKFK